MAWKLYAGWDFGDVGLFSMVFNDGSDRTAAIFSGRFCHVDIGSVMGTGIYDDIASRIKSVMDAAGGGVTYAVTFDTSTLRFSIQRSVAAVWTITSATNTVARNVLGVNSFPVSSDANGLLTTQITPYYVIAGALGAASETTDDYEPDGVAAGAVADDGVPYAVSRLTAPTLSDFTIMFETEAAVRARKASASVPWTWEHFMKHVRGAQPFLVQDGVDSTVHKLRPEIARHKPRRAEKEWNAYWHERLETYVLGRL